MKKLSEIFSEQHREKGRFKPTIPRMVPNKPNASPRADSDSANVSLRERCWTGYRQIGLKKKGDKVVPNCVQDSVEVKEGLDSKEEMQVQGTAAMTLTDKPNKEPMKKLKEASAAAIAAATAISKKKSGNYDKKGMRVKPYKNPDAPNVKSNAERRKEMNEAKDVREYDYEGDMAKTQLKTIIRNAQNMHDMLDEDANLPEWVQSKITLAKDYIVTAANYLESEMNEEVKKSDIPAYLRKQQGQSPLKLSDLKRKDTISDKENLAKLRNEGAVPAKEKTVMVRHKTSGKELVVTQQKAKELQKHDYHSVKEEVEQIDEKNVPTSPEKWARAKAQAKAKFDVYPSAYANGWAAKKYKEMGGGWKSVSEAKEQEPPFDKPYTTTKGTITDKSGAKHTPMSRARDIARMAMKKQAETMKKMPMKEETRKAAIVKEVMKKKKASEDAFQKDPELSTTLTKVQI